MNWKLLEVMECKRHKYPEMLKMIIDGKLHPEKLIEKTITLEEATKALPNMNTFQNKGVLVINSF